MKEITYYAITSAVALLLYSSTLAACFLLPPPRARMAGIWGAVLTSLLIGWSWLHHFGLIGLMSK
jgi:hypothetical protein